MKKLLALIVLSVSAITMAQETVHKIPNDAIVVASVKGGNLLQLISMDELNDSFFGKAILKDANRKNVDGYASLEDFGLSLAATSHYFHHINDSINYNAFVIPIKDSSKFEDFLLKQTGDELVTLNGIRTFKENGNTSMVWNENTLVIVKGSLSARYFDREEVTNRYGLQSEPTYDYDVVTEAAVDAADDYDDAVEDAAETLEKTALEIEEAEEVWAVEEIEEVVIEDDKSVYSEEVVDVNDYYNNNFNNIYYANQNIKTNLVKEWALQQAIKIISQSESQSIIHNKSYQSSLDKDAEATLWVKDFGVL